MFSASDGATAFRVPLVGGQLARIADMGAGRKVFGRSLDGADEKGDDSVAPAHQRREGAF